MPTNICNSTLFFSKQVYSKAKVVATLISDNNNSDHDDEAKHQLHPHTCRVQASRTIRGTIHHDWFNVS